MPAKYEIIINQTNDLKNWSQAISSKYINLIMNDFADSQDKKFAKSVSTDSGEGTVIQEYLNQKYYQNNKIIEKIKNQLVEIFQKDFNKSINIIEKITRHEVYRSSFTIYLTTIPFMMYSYKSGVIYFYIYNDDPIKVFMHELLHFQFIHYWRKNPDSPVHKLPNHLFEYLKESLTVVLDEDILPIIKSIDNGYPSQQELRKELRAHWKKYHDFDKLVKYGIEKLPEFADLTDKQSGGLI